MRDESYSSRRIDSDRNVSKFWTVGRIGPEVHATFGRLGTGGQTQVKLLGTAAEADRHVERVLDEKSRKGYSYSPAPWPTSPVLARRLAAPPEAAPPTPADAGVPAPSPRYVGLG